MPYYQINGVGPTVPGEGDCWIAPSADLIGDVRLGVDASIWFGTVIRADNTPIIVGAESNLQENCTLHSDPGAPLTIGRGVTVGHNVILHGCTIGDHAMIGMGSTIMNNAVIGAESIVGAGALVTEGKAFPPRSMILGAPAKAVRTLSEEEVAGLHRAAAGYVKEGRHYASGLARCD